MNLNFEFESMGKGLSECPSQGSPADIERAQVSTVLAEEAQAAGGRQGKATPLTDRLFLEHGCRLRLQSEYVDLDSIQAVSALGDAVKLELPEGATRNAGALALKYVRYHLPGLLRENGWPQGLPVTIRGWERYQGTGYPS